jgi:hypothetical protein
VDAAPLPAGPGAGAHRHGTRAAVTLPPRLTATPPAFEPQGESRPSLCPRCQAKNPWNARLCGRCGAEVPPPAPGDAPDMATRVGVGVNLPGAPTWVERIPVSEQFVPEGLAAERESKRRAEDQARTTLEAALVVPPEERRRPALTGGAFFAVVSFVLLSWLGPTALEALPLSFLLGSGASWLMLKLPDPGTGEVTFGIASALTVLASGALSTIGVLLVILGAVSGGFASYLVRERRRLLVLAPDAPGAELAGERARRLGRDVARMRAVTAGAVLLAVAWSPCALALGRERAAPFLTYALMLGAVATVLVLGKLGRARSIVAFSVAGLVLVLSGLRTAPAFAVLGLLLSGAAGYGLGRLLPILLPGEPVTGSPSGSP